MQLSFNRIDEGWYLDIPEWDGEEEVLRVEGSDAYMFFNYLSLFNQDDSKIAFELFEEEPTIGDVHTWELIEENDEWVTFEMMFYPEDSKDVVKLPALVKTLFGNEIPKLMYFEVIEN